MLILAGATRAKEKATTQDEPQQGVSLLFPADTGKQTKGAKLSKEQKKAAALLQKLKAIEKGGNVNAADKRGQTALMYAAAANNRLAVCWLVAKGADATKKSQKGKTSAELAKDESLRAFLEACCVDNRPLSAEEKKQLQAKYPDPDEVEYLIQRCRGKDSPENLKLLTQLLRLGYSPSVKGGPLIARDPLLATLLSRHGRTLSTEGQTGYLGSELARLLIALDIKVGNDDALSHARIAMLLDDADALRKVVTAHPDIVKNRGQASQIIAGLGSPETLQVLIEAGLDPKLSWNGRYNWEDSKDCFIEDILTGPRRSAAGIRALAAAGAPLPVYNERRNILTADMEDHSYDPEVIDALIEAGADVNAIGSGKADRRGAPSGLPPLVLAAMRYGGQAVSHLLSKGAQINARWVEPGTSFDGRTALYSAIIQGSPEVVRLLLQKGADTKAIPEGKKSILKLAVNSGNYDKVKALLDHGVPMEDDVLQSLPSDTNKPSADEIEKLAFYLLEHGAKVQSVDAKNGYTPLMNLGWLSERIAKRLLDDGADPNAIAEEDGVKLCALGLTLQRGRSDIAKYLQQRGAKMVGDLLLAKPEDMRAMLEAGASVPEDLFKKMNFSAIGSHGNPTAGHAPELTLEELTEAAKILRDAGAKPTMRCMYNYNLGDAGVPALLAAGADPNEKNEWDEYFFFTGNIMDPTITPLFLKAGVNINLQDKKGNTALLRVCQAGPRYLGQQELLVPLLKAGADPNIKNKEGKTALQYAREKKADAFIKLLQEHGAKE